MNIDIESPAIIAYMIITCINNSYDYCLSCKKWNDGPYYRVSNIKKQVPDFIFVCKDCYIKLTKGNNLCGSCGQIVNNSHNHNCT